MEAGGRSHTVTFVQPTSFDDFCEAPAASRQQTWLLNLSEPRLTQQCSHLLARYRD